jgi:hypothetical protein
VVDEGASSEQRARASSPDRAMTWVWFDFPEEARSSFSASVLAVPRVGESVGIRIHEPPREGWIKFYPVIDVRHYTEPEPEIRVVLGKP